VKETTTVEEFRKVFDESPDFENLLLETGYKTPPSRLVLDEKLTVMSVVADFHCMMKTKAANDQFIEGLKASGVLQYLQQYPEVMKPLFYFRKSPLTTGKLNDLLFL